MSDLIRREDAIKAVDSFSLQTIEKIRLDRNKFVEVATGERYTMTKEEVKKLLSDLPSVEPPTFDLETEWTPVSKGLPDLEYDYEFEGHDFYSSDPVLVTTEDGRRTIAHYEAEDVFISDSSEGIWYSEEEDGLHELVSAWMPLPSVYKED